MQQHLFPSVKVFGRYAELKQTREKLLKIIGVAILIIIAFILFALYVYGKGTNPILAGALVLLFFVALPWLVVRGSLFNARNSSHRCLRFDFVGTVSKAVRIFIILPMLTLFTLGLIWPYIAHERNHFLMSNHRFGLSQFDMKRVVKQFYKVYMMLITPPTISPMINSIKGQELIKAKHTNQSQLIVPADMAVLVTVNQQPTIKLAATDILADPQIDQEMQEKMSEQELAIRAEEMAQEDAAEQPISKTQKLLQWLQHPSKLLFMLLGGLAYLLFIFGFLGYLQARIGNLIWNNTTLDKLSFKSSLRARDFAWLYLTNIVAIMLTFGLATPWAQIRMARYRASKMQIVGDVDFDQFVGDKKAEVKATGEEIAEMFDVDLSFG